MSAVFHSRIILSDIEADRNIEKWIGKSMSKTADAVRPSGQRNCICFLFSMEWTRLLCHLHSFRREGLVGSVNGFSF